VHDIIGVHFWVTGCVFILITDHLATKFSSAFSPLCAGPANNAAAAATNDRMDRLKDAIVRTLSALVRRLVFVVCSSLSFILTIRVLDFVCFPQSGQRNGGLLGGNKRGDGR
jgi:hypothetical protein